MISVKYGEVKISGSMVEVGADIITAFTAVVDVLARVDESKDYSETVIKSMFYAMAREVKDRGH